MVKDNKLETCISSYIILECFSSRIQSMPKSRRSPGGFPEIAPSVRDLVLDCISSQMIAVSFQYNFRTGSNSDMYLFQHPIQRPLSTYKGRGEHSRPRK